jgi:hypothetical protein
VLPFLETLTDIEKQLSEAEESEDSAKKITIEKDYFEKSIYKNIRLIRTM